MRGLKLFVAVVAGGWALLGTAGWAADCAGPTIEHTAGTVDRGAAITIRGEAFGDNCYDTGPPPPGEDILGNPLQNVEIVFVQGGEDFVAARGNANRDFRFAVDVPLPRTLQPGDVTVEARWPNGGVAVNTTPEPLVVSNTAVQGADPEVANFGASETPTPAPTSDDDSDTNIPLIAAFAAASIIAATGTWCFRRSTRPKA